MTRVTADEQPASLRGVERPSAPARAWARLRQFFRGLRAEVTDVEMRHASSRLPHAAFGIFLLLPVDAQRHSLNVLRALEEAGPVGDDLAAAALLHDVGKLAAAQAGHPISLWVRGPLVLLDAFAPGLAARLSSPDPSREWRFTLHVHAHHAAIGAEWAAEAGCSPQTCWLIAHHQDHAAHADARQAQELARLQWADSIN